MSEQAWCMKGPRGNLVVGHLKDTRTRAIKSLTAMFTLEHKKVWRKLKRGGWSCVKVTVSEMSVKSDTKGTE